MKNFNPISEGQFEAIRDLFQPLLPGKYTQLKSGNIKIEINENLHFYLGVNEERGYFIRRARRSLDYGIVYRSWTPLHYDKKTHQYNFSNLLDTVSYFLNYLINNKYIK